MKSSVQLMLMAVFIMGSFTACKKQTSKRRLKGNWDIVSYHYLQSADGTCGVGGGTVLFEQTNQNMGYIEFTGDDVADKSYAGSFHYNYTDASGNVNTYDQPFTYTVWKGGDGWKVTMEDDATLLYEIWPLDDLGRKKWNVKMETSYDCYVETIEYTLEKQ